MIGIEVKLYINETKSLVGLHLEHRFLIEGPWIVSLAVVGNFFRLAGHNGIKVGVGTIFTLKSILELFSIIINLKQMFAVHIKVICGSFVACRLDVAQAWSVGSM